MKKAAITQRQEHIIHIGVLGVFMVGLFLLQNTAPLQNTYLVIMVSALYAIINIIVDWRANALHIDRILEYIALSALASVVMLIY